MTIDASNIIRLNLVPASANHSDAVLVILPEMVPEGQWEAVVSVLSAHRLHGTFELPFRGGSVLQINLSHFRQITFLTKADMEG